MKKKPAKNETTPRNFCLILPVVKMPVVNTSDEENIASDCKLSLIAMSHPG